MKFKELKEFKDFNAFRDYFKLIPDQEKKEHYLQLPSVFKVLLACWNTYQKQGIKTPLHEVSESNFLEFREEIFQLCKRQLANGKVEVGNSSPTVGLPQETVAENQATTTKPKENSKAKTNEPEAKVETVTATNDGQG